MTKSGSFEQFTLSKDELVNLTIWYYEGHTDYMIGDGSEYISLGEEEIKELIRILRERLDKE